MLNFYPMVVSERVRQALAGVGSSKIRAFGADLPGSLTLCVINCEEPTGPGPGLWWHCSVSVRLPGDGTHPTRAVRLPTDEEMLDVAEVIMKTYQPVETKTNHLMVRHIWRKQ